MKKSNTKEFIDKAKKVHGDKYDYSQVNYVDSKTKIKIICPIHGVFEQQPNNHLTGFECLECGGKKKLTTHTFIDKAKKAHNDKYDYSQVNYVNNRTKIKIICPTHGVFEQTPNDHLNGYGCPDCGGTKRLTTDKFIDKAKEIHADRYDYSLCDYKTTIKKVKLICPTHGAFEITPNNHLNGKGCRQCGLDNGVWSYSLWEQKGLKSVNYDSFKLYIIECWDDNERFYKIGKTFKSIQKRFKGSKHMPYQYKVIKFIEGDARYISELELELKNSNKENSYLPKKQFNGRYECFSNVSY